MADIVKSAGRMGLATLISRFLGLAREQVFAFLFGASDAADAFNIAFRIPNLLRDLFAEGAMSSAFVPNFTRALVTSKQMAFELLAAVLSILFWIVGFIAVIGILFSPDLVGLYAGSFQQVPGKFNLTVGLTQSMFPFFPLVAMAAVTMGALNALGYFFLPAFAPAMFNLASILCGLVLCPLMERFSTIPSIYGMAIGVVIGGFLQFFIQWLKVTKEGFHFSKFLAAIFSSPFKLFKKPGVKAVFLLLVPGTIGLAATQLNILINSVYATSQGSGAVSWLNYAFRLMQFPIGVFGVSLAVANLAQVSRRLAVEDFSAASKEVKQALVVSLAVNGPATAGLMAVGLPIVQLLFEHGRFVESDSLQTYYALFAYAWGLCGYSIVKILVPVYYALGSTRFPVALSFVIVALNALLNHVFLNLFHLPFWVLALSTSVTSSLNAVFLLAGLVLFYRDKLPNVFDFPLLKKGVLHISISGVIGFFCYFTVHLLGYFRNIFYIKEVFWAAQISISMFVALFLWWSAGRLFKISEIENAFNLLKKRR